MLFRSERQQLGLKRTQLWYKTDGRAMDIHMVKAQIWPEEHKNGERPTINADMDDVRMMVGKWCADWAKKRREEGEAKGAVSSWMTAATSIGNPDDPTILCEEGDNFVSGMTRVMTRVPEVEVIMTDDVIPIGKPEGALANGIEESEEHE